VLAWGYQPERFFAGLLIFFYTLAASLPLLLALLLVGGRAFSVFMGAFCFFCAEKPATWLALTVTLAFLVKFPLFGVHL
jgi:NADH:ubiquinone oxidoreductase subunit 4 (subunit M)